MTSTSGPVEPCEGGCGSQVFTVRHDGERRPALREVVKLGSVEHSPDRCREVKAALVVAEEVKAAEKAEAKKVVRHFQRYTSEQRAGRASAHTQGHRQKQSVGEYFYTHPARPGVAFGRRIDAARAGVAALRGA